MKERRINTGKLELHIREYENDGEAIIFLHFGGWNLEMWQGVVPYFQNDYHLILVDLRGHGRSDKPSKGYHIDDIAGDIASIMEKLEIKKAHIVGSSMGAEVGLSIAANYPDMTLSLVLGGALFNEYGQYGLWTGTEEEFKVHVSQTLKNIRSAPDKIYPSVDALVEESQKAFEEYGWWSEIFEAVKRYDAVEIEDGKYTKSWQNSSNADYLENYYSHRLEDYYKKVKCPIMMLPDEIPGQDEREKEVMEGLFALVDKGAIVAVPGWVHPFGWMLTPEPISKAVLKFLSDVNDF